MVTVTNYFFKSVKSNSKKFSGKRMIMITSYFLTNNFPLAIIFLFLGTGMPKDNQIKEFKCGHECFSFGQGGNGKVFVDT